MKTNHISPTFPDKSGEELFEEYLKKFFEAMKLLLEDPALPNPAKDLLLLAIRRKALTELGLPELSGKFERGYEVRKIPEALDMERLSMQTEANLDTDAHRSMSPERQARLTEAYLATRNLYLKKLLKYQG